MRQTPANRIRADREIMRMLAFTMLHVGMNRAFRKGLRWGVGFSCTFIPLHIIGTAGDSPCPSGPKTVA